MGDKVATMNSTAESRSFPRNRLFVCVMTISIALAVVALGVQAGALACLIFLLIARRRRASKLIVLSLVIAFGVLLCLSALLLADSLSARTRIEWFSIVSP